MRWPRDSYTAKYHAISLIPSQKNKMLLQPRLPPTHGCSHWHATSISKFYHFIYSRLDATRVNYWSQGYFDTRSRLYSTGQFTTQPRLLAFHLVFVRWQRWLALMMDAVWWVALRGGYRALYRHIDKHDAKHAASPRFKVNVYYLTHRPIAADKLTTFHFDLCRRVYRSAQSHTAIKASPRSSLAGEYRAHSFTRPKIFLALFHRIQNTSPLPMTSSAVYSFQVGSRRSMICCFIFTKICLMLI
jgi:hypothetical protein